MRRRKVRERGDVRGGVPAWPRPGETADRACRRPRRTGRHARARRPLPRHRRRGPQHPLRLVPMDVRMPGIDCIGAGRRIAGSGGRSRVLVLTAFDVDAHAYEALRAGAGGSRRGDDATRRPHRARTPRTHRTSPPTGPTPRSPNSSTAPIRPSRPPPATSSPRSRRATASRRDLRLRHRTRAPAGSRAACLVLAFPGRHAQEKPSLYARALRHDDGFRKAASPHEGAQPHTCPCGGEPRVPRRWQAS